MRTFDHTCPDCGGQMVKRRNGVTHEDFWGCVSYPSCTGTRRITGNNDVEDLPSSRHERNDRRRWERENESYHRN